MRFELICIVIVAIFWGGYPLLARTTGIGGAVGALVLTLSALAPIATAAIWQSGSVRPSSGEMLRLIIAGAMMGIGLLAFNAVANSKNMEASISIPIIDTAMLLVSVIGAILFFSEPVTAKKLIGIGLLVAGILVLRPE